MIPDLINDPEYLTEEEIDELELLEDQEEELKFEQERHNDFDEE